MIELNNTEKERAGFILMGLAAVFLAAGVAATLLAQSVTGAPNEPRTLRVCRPSPERPCSCIDANLKILGNGDVACTERP